MSPPPPQVRALAPSCAAEALHMVEAAWDFLNDTDVAAVPVPALAECLGGWHRLEAKQTAAAIRLTTAFEAACGPAADGQRTLACWLAAFGRVTKAAARAFTGRCRRLRGHEAVRAALAEGSITVSVAEWIAEAVAVFPTEDRDSVERILVEAAAGGALPGDLAALAGRMFQLLVPDGPDARERAEDADRRLTLGRTLGGAGRMNADLNRRATALADQVISALAVRKGPEDTRTAPQRRHDALAEAFQRLVDAGLLPERGGTKPHLRLEIPLAALRRMNGAAEAEAGWIRTKATELVRQRAAENDATHEARRDSRKGHRQPIQHRHPEAHGPTEAQSRTKPHGHPDAHDGTKPHRHPEAQGRTEGRGPAAHRDRSEHRAHEEDRPCHAGGPCPDGGHGEEDAFMAGAPAILGGVGPISDGLAESLACDAKMTPTVTGHVDSEALAGLADDWLAGHRLAGREPCGAAGSACGCDCHQPLDPAAHVRLRRSLLHWAVRVLSGPDGLASHLRRATADRMLGGPSIVLDVGADLPAVPAALERAVRTRDRTCRFPHCDHPAELSQVHHIVPRGRHGPTSMGNLLTLCAFHHLTVVHTWGWTIRLDPDGIVTATSPQGVDLHGAGPPGSRPPRRAA